MAIFPNHTKQQLDAGKLALGMGMRVLRSVDAGMIAKTTGFDWLFIDMEHSSMDVDQASQVAVTAMAMGVTPIVRVPGKEHHHASRLLDSGAQGIVVPHVDTAEEAARVVSHCKYPPMGHRSMMGVLPQFAYESTPPADAVRLSNEQILVTVMVETPLAIENAEAIAAVPGVDVVLIGTNDLCAEMGIPGQFDDARVEDAYRKVIAACKKHGKHPGMGGVYDPPLMARYIGMGMRMILSGGDLGFLMAGAKARAGFLRGCKL
jgi:2-keto-3-deoxy-L-rhamnonate aldolase RhmA